MHAEVLRRHSWGPGAPHLQLVMLPGNPGSAAYYIPFLQAIHKSLDSRAHIYAVSYAGHSDFAADQVPLLYSLEQQIEHKVAFLQDHILHAGKPPVVVLGHSIGTYIAIHAVHRTETNKHAAKPPQDRAPSLAAQEEETDQAVGVTRGRDHEGGDLQEVANGTGCGTGSGVASGTGSGVASGNGSGVANGTGSGTGSGVASGTGSGVASGTGSGTGSGAVEGAAVGKGEGSSRLANCPLPSSASAPKIEAPPPVAKVEPFLDAITLAERAVMSGRGMEFLCMRGRAAGSGNGRGE